MASLNKVMLMGRLTHDPVLRENPATQQPITTFSVATSRWMRRDDGGNSEVSDYHNCVAFTRGQNRLAENVANYCRKGSLVYVEGHLQTRTWEGKDGLTHKETEILATTVEFLEPKDRGLAGVAASDQFPLSNVNPEEVPF